MEPPKATPLFLSQPTLTYWRWIPPLEVSKTSQNRASAGAQHPQECISFWGDISDSHHNAHQFQFQKNLGYKLPTHSLSVALYSEDSKTRKFLGEKNHLQLSTTWACKFVGSRLLLSYKQAKSLKGFNFPAWGFVMGLLYAKVPNCFKGNGFMKNPMRRSRTYGSRSKL